MDQKYKGKYKVLPPIKASRSIQARYQKALLSLIKDMQASVEWYCVAAFKPISEDLDKTAKKQDGSREG